MAEGNVDHGAASAEDADATLPPGSESGEAFSDVTAGGDFHNVGAKGVGAIAGYDYWRLRLIFGAGRPAAGAASEFTVRSCVELRWFVVADLFVV